MNLAVWMNIASFIVTAIISIIVTLLVVKRQEQHKELFYRIESLSLLSPFGKSWVKGTPNIKIFYDNKEVPQMFSFRITFRNSGNQTLEGLPIRLKPNPEAEILSLTAEAAKDIETGGIHYLHIAPPAWDVQVGFLNKGDEIKVYGIGTGNDEFELTVTVPQPSVKTRNRPEFWTRRSLGEKLKIWLSYF